MRRAGLAPAASERNSQPAGRGASPPSAGQGPPGSEFATPPAAVIVHEVEVSAFEVMHGINDDQLERKLLFRSRPDPQRYVTQHRSLVDVLRRHVPRVLYLADILRDDPSYRTARLNPNLVFTRDALITLPWCPGGYVCPRMKEPIRRGETSLMEEAVRRLGLSEIARAPETVVLEGGDVVPFAREGSRTLLVGYGPRTTVEALDFLQDALIPRICDEIVGVRLAPWRMNLDGGLLPVAEDVVVCDTTSILDGLLIDGRDRARIDVLDMLRELGVTIIETTVEESIFLQSCNCACLGGRRIVYYDLCPRVHDLLVRQDVEVLSVPGSELVKGRGGPRCMTRPVYAAQPSSSPPEEESPPDDSSSAFSPGSSGELGSVGPPGIGSPL